ncbi:MAG: MlaD family protein [Sphingobacteriales bacterium]|jgi:phospholipid/cholesterol/gamma-HCH transport system substrate-binding protein|nr:MlaD family protein [Sphingobacteriales bacterium]
MVKVSNETKVGAIAVVVITLLILGFNFLKGNQLFSNNLMLYAKYDNVQGLTPSSPVIINGLQVGTVKAITNDKNMRELVVSFSIKKDINIPTNSLALIVPNPLATTKAEIKLGDANQFMKDGDTLETQANKGILDDVMKRVDPVLYEVKNAVSSLDTLLGKVNKVLDPEAKENISKTLSNLNQVTASMLLSTASLQQLLNTETGALAKTLQNVKSITGNLADNNAKISSVMTNLDQTTTKLSELDLKQTLTSIDGTINDLRKLMAGFNTKDGTIGLLLNDPSLYKNLASTSNKLNLLLDDLRVNPKRYVNISVFGKKQKSEALAVPLPDTLNSPYLIKKAE